MIELKDEKTREEYIERLCQEKLGVSPEKIDFVNEGVMNYVFSVDTPKGRIYFKQALPTAKHADKIGADLRALPMERTECEFKVMKILEGIIPDYMKVPTVLNYDKENNILAMTDISEGGNLLQSRLLEGDFNPLVSSRLGEFLGIMHRETYGKSSRIRKADRENWLLFLNMRSRGINCTGLDEKVGEELKKLYISSLEDHTHSMMINMDICPKNLIQRKNSEVGILDMELSSGMGDPAYDIGFSLGHYFLFSKIAGCPEESLEAIRNQSSSYLREIESIRREFGNLEERMLKYAGAVMIYRVAGSSPAGYIPREMVQDIKETGGRIVTSGTDDVDKAIEILSS